jgi:hypothetical protein
VNQKLPEAGRPAAQAQGKPYGCALTVNTKLYSPYPSSMEICDQKIHRILALDTPHLEWGEESAPPFNILNTVV